MVSHVIFAFAMACISLTTIAKETALPRQVKAVTIMQHGLSEHGDDYARKLCKAFNPRVAQIRKFLQQAKEVDSRIHTHDRYSPCYATGIVEFSDGSKGEWQIHSGRTGILKTAPDQAVVLYCKTCRWKDPFAGTYDVKSD